MSESNVPTDAPATAISKRRGPLNLALPVSVLALALAAWSVWQGLGASREFEAAGKTERLNAQAVVTLQRESSELSRIASALERRLGDAEGVNRSVRQEVLGLGERARLVEDAVARLADRDLSGSILMRLNEADFLLRMGAERLALFDDAAGTVAAYKLADAELAVLDDPLFTGVRQTIAAEIESLTEVRRTDRNAWLRELDAIADAVGRLSPRAIPADSIEKTVELPEGAAWFDRVAATLAQFVRVRELPPEAANSLRPLTTDAARISVLIELMLAKSALVTGDQAGLRSAIERARSQLVAGFDPEQAPAAPALGALDALLEMPEQEPWPQIGRALGELRNLRATRAMAADSSAATTSKRKR